MKLQPASTGSRSTTILPLLCLSLLIAGCNMPGRAPDDNGGVETPAETMSMEQALAVQPEDRRPTVLEEMGAPDVFQIHFEQLDGQAVRWESWSYFDFQSAFEFIDGELLWTIELEPAPDGSFYAHFYDPHDFQAFMSVAEVRTLLEGQELEQVDLTEGDLQGGLILAGDQILLGFDQDRLVYVETFMLSPAAEGEPAGFPAASETEPQAATATPEASAPAPTSAATPILAPSGAPTNTVVPGQPAPRTNGELVLEDTYEGTASQASPLFGSEFMSFEQASGKGRIGSEFPQGVMVATYSTMKLADFIAEFDLSAENPTAGLKAGLIFRSEDAAEGLDYYYNLVLLPFEKRVGLTLWKDGAWKLDESYPIPANLVPEDGNYRVRIEVEGEQFRVFLNGSFLYEFSDVQLAGAGIFGLSLISAQPPEAVSFDNLRIYELQ